MKPTTAEAAALAHAYGDNTFLSGLKAYCEMRAQDERQNIVNCVRLAVPNIPKQSSHAGALEVYEGFVNELRHYLEKHL